MANISPAYDMGMAHLGMGGIPLFIIVIALAWSLIWKGFALWYAARNNQKVWYVVMLLVGTIGILEIIYLVFFRADRKKKVVLVETDSADLEAPNTTIVEEVVIDE